MPVAMTSEAPVNQDLSPQAPKWLSSAIKRLRSQYPHDQIVLRQIKGLVNIPGTGNEENITATVPVWRIGCLDCPGKVYLPGPSETLSNFEVHMRNRQHRTNVNTRVGLAPPVDNVPVPATVQGTGNNDGDSPKFLLSSL